MDRRSLITGVVVLILIACFAAWVPLGGDSPNSSANAEFTADEAGREVIAVAKKLGVNLDPTTLDVRRDSTPDTDTLKWIFSAKSVQGDSFWGFVGTRNAGVSLIENVTVIDRKHIVLHEPGVLVVPNNEEAKRFLLPIVERISNGKPVRLKSLENRAGTMSSRATLKATFEYIVQGYPFVDQNPALAIGFISQAKTFQSLSNYPLMPEVSFTKPRVSEQQARRAAANRIGLSDKTAANYMADLGWAVPEGAKVAVLCWRIMDKKKVVHVYVDASSGQVAKYKLTPRK